MTTTVLRTAALSMTTALVIGLLTYLAFILDDGLGLLAYRNRYLLFTAVAAAGVAWPWLTRSRNVALAIALLTLAALLSPTS